MNIRPLQVEDSLNLIELLAKIDQETSFSPYMPGERRTNAFQVATAMATGNQVIFGAEILGKLVGYVSLSRELAARIQHNAVLGLAVLQDHRRQGIGKQLMAQAEEWARFNGLRRLELTVSVQNEPALQLYRSLGFQIEGTKREAFFAEDAYQDEYMMAKLLL